MSATLRDVAKVARVAESTASRALAGFPAISSDTRERVIKAAEQLGYSRPRRISATSSERRGLVGVVVVALHNSFYAHLVDNIHDELDAHGFDMILIIDELSNVRLGPKFEMLVNNSLDGIIFATASVDSPTVDLLVGRNIPIVLAVRSNQRGNASVVESDNATAGAEATRHLIELGHHNIGFLMGPRDTSTSVDRLQGCQRELDSAGLTATGRNVIWGSYSHDSGYSGLMQLMNLADAPTGVVCANDVIAIGALDACQKRQIRVPQEVSIVGVDDIPMASWSMIALTTVRQSVAEIGCLAARRVVERIQGRNDQAPTHDILPTSIVRRKTTAVPKPVT